MLKHVNELILNECITTEKLRFIETKILGLQWTIR